MKLEIHGKLELDGFDKIIAARGLGPGRAVQRFVDEEVIRLCDPKVPFDSGTLKHSALTASAIGDGLVVYNTPYARYLYYGEVYGPNVPIYENGTLVGFFSPPHKHPTGEKLTYQGAPERGALWFERMKAEHADDIARAAAALAGGRSK